MRTTRKTVVICRILALALTVLLPGTALAQAQNPFAIDGTVTDAVNSKLPAVGGAAIRSEDLHLNEKELGPVQGSGTKFPVIHTASAPMLGTSNPNGQTDLHVVYTQTEKDAAGNSWFYFGWTRDSNSGSGFISFEAHQTPNDCESYSPADLANCNPWSPRTADDFVVFWDQSGNSTSVYLRVWNGTSFQPGQPGLLLNSLTDTNGDPVVFAQYSSDFSRGEMALNLTGAGLVAVNECKAFANVIPGTITGNSQGDQADFKDVVLAPISINTCGTVTVTKVTQGPDGKNKLDTTSVFSYTLKKGAATIATSTLTGCTAADPDPCNGPVDTHEDLLAGTDYTLTEATPPGEYLFQNIVCGSTTLANGGSFTVPESGIVACTITNRLPLGDPILTTRPSVNFVFYDELTINLDNKIADNTTVNNVTFELYADNPGAQCTGTPIATRTRSVTFADGLVGTATTSPSGAGTETIPTGDYGIVVSTSGTYHWKVSYPGDSLNKAVSQCGETTSVSKTLPQ